MAGNRKSGGTGDRKRIEKRAKAGDRIPEQSGGDDSSRLEQSRGPGEDPEKRRVVEKIGERGRDS